MWHIGKRIWANEEKNMVGKFFHFYLRILTLFSKFWLKSPNTEFWSDTSGNKVKIMRIKLKVRMFTLKSEFWDQSENLTNLVFFLLHWPLIFYRRNKPSLLRIRFIHASHACSKLDLIFIHETFNVQSMKTYCNGTVYYYY